MAEHNLSNRKWQFCVKNNLSQCSEFKYVFKKYRAAHKNNIMRWVLKFLEFGTVKNPNKIYVDRGSKSG